jgi:hypothetical protein
MACGGTELILVHTLGGTGGCQRRWISRVTPLTTATCRVHYEIDVFGEKQ